MYRSWMDSEVGYMKKKRKWREALFNCFYISLLLGAVYQVKEPRPESVAETVCFVITCTLAFYMWYAFGVLICNYARKQSAGQEGGQYHSGTKEPKRIVAADILDVRYKTKVKTNYPKAFVMSALGRRKYGQMGGILGAASGSRLETIPKKVVFAVPYSDGTKRREKVNYGSMRYRMLMRYVEE